MKKSVLTENAINAPYQINIVRKLSDFDAFALGGNSIEDTKVESSIIDVDSKWEFSGVTFENSITIIDGQLTKY